MEDSNLFNKGAILLLSGPSGCGKSSLLKELYKVMDNYYFSISTTTREPRVGEVNGVDYFFVTKEEFEQDIKDGNFLEYAQVHGNYYGTSLKAIQKALSEAKLVIFDIDVQGFEQVKANKKIDKVTTTLFITTPSLAVLEERLTARGTEAPDVIAKRISNAQKEIQYIDQYDYFLINDEFEKTASQLISIAQSALLKAKLFDKEAIIQKWV